MTLRIRALLAFLTVAVVVLSAVVGAQQMRMQDTDDRITDLHANLNDFAIQSGFDAACVKERLEALETGVTIPEPEPGEATCRPSP